MWFVINGYDYPHFWRDLQDSLRATVRTIRLAASLEWADIVRHIPPDSKTRGQHGLWRFERGEGTRDIDAVLQAYAEASGVTVGAIWSTAYYLWTLGQGNPESPDQWVRRSIHLSHNRDDEESALGLIAVVMAHKDQPEYRGGEFQGKIPWKRRATDNGGTPSVPPDQVPWRRRATD